MRAVSREFQERNIETIRPNDRDTDQMVGSFLSDVASAIWPTNTAANLAAQVGCSVRAAERYLGGQREWSGDAVAVVVSEILKRHKMRNVKVVKRRDQGE